MTTQTLSNAAQSYYREHFYVGGQYVRAVNAAGDIRVVYWDEQAATGNYATIPAGTLPTSDATFLLQKFIADTLGNGDPSIAMQIGVDLPLYLISPTLAKWSGLRQKYVLFVDSLRLRKPDRMSPVPFLAAGVLIAGGLYFYSKR